MEMENILNISTYQTFENLLKAKSFLNDFAHLTRVNSPVKALFNDYIFVNPLLKLYRYES